MSLTFVSTIKLTCPIAVQILHDRWSWAHPNDPAISDDHVLHRCILHPKHPSSLSHVFTIAVSSAYYREIAAAYTNSWSDASSTQMIIYLSLSCALNVYLTAHIVYVMVYLVWTNETSENRTVRRRIAAMFVQNTLLYLIPTLAFIVLCAQRSLGQNFLFPIMCQIQASLFFFAFVDPADAPLDRVQALSPLLVIMRVAQRRHLDSDGVVVTKDSSSSLNETYPRPMGTLGP